MGADPGGVAGPRTGLLAEDTLDHTDPASDGYSRQGGHVQRGQDRHSRAEGGIIYVHADPSGWP